MDRPIASVEAAEAAGTAPAVTSQFGWSAIFAGALAGTAFGAILLTFGLGIGLSLASPAATWEDTSAGLAFASGLWLLLTALGSFALGGYIVGRMRMAPASAGSEEAELGDGLHGLTMWAIVVVFATLFGLGMAAIVSPRAGNLAAPNASTAEALLAFELDHLFRSERAPGQNNEGDARAQAARIISSELGHSGISPDDRSYLVRLTAARTGLMPSEAEGRVAQVLREADTAVANARHSAVILAFMTAISLLLGAATAWYTALLGAEHRDHDVVPSFWIRQPSIGIGGHARSGAATRR